MESFAPGVVAQLAPLVGVVQLAPLVAQLAPLERLALVAQLALVASGGQQLPALSP